MRSRVLSSAFQHESFVSGTGGHSKSTPVPPTTTATDIKSQKLTNILDGQQPSPHIWRSAPEERHKITESISSDVKLVADGTEREEQSSTALVPYMYDHNHNHNANIEGNK